MKLKYRLQLEQLNVRDLPSTTPLDPPPPPDSSIVIQAWSSFTVDITAPTQPTQAPPDVLLPGTVSGTPDPIATAVASFQQWFAITFSQFNPMPGTSYDGLVEEYSLLLQAISCYDDLIQSDIAAYGEAQQRLTDFELANVGVPLNPNAQPLLGLITDVNSAGYAMYQNINARNEVAAAANAIMNFLQACKGMNWLTFQQSVALGNLATTSPPPQLLLITINAITIITPGGFANTPGWPMPI